jgi:site-specific recombinase XerD
VKVAGTPNQDRTVYIPDSLAELHRRYVRDIRPHLLPDGVSAKDQSLELIFNERGRPYERTALYRRVVRILSEVGLKDRASVQLLRHTYGYLAYLRTGGNLLFVQKQLGHAHPMVTAIYAQFVEHPYDQLANQVERPVSPPVIQRKVRKVH